MGDIADFYLDSAMSNEDFDPRDEEFGGLPALGSGACPKCKGSTTLRQGPYGEFYGCSSFPKCNGTRKVHGW